MRMLGKTLKFVAFLAIFSVAPATASRTATPHYSPCPVQRAREMAAEAAAARAAAATVKAPTTITLSDRLPVLDRWFSGFGRGPSVLTP
jgi:hypothetical protein